MKKYRQIDLGFLEIPKNYIEMSEKEKVVICNHFIDILINYVDHELAKAPHINRVDFLSQILESTLITNEEYENYEICSVIRDMQQLLHED